MRVVSNSTPLIYLAKTNKLSLLREVFKTVIIPREVFNEVVVRGRKEGYSEVVAIEEAIRGKWLQVKDAKVDLKLFEIAREIDRGEAEAISLGRNIKADLILIDDATGRKVAESLGLNAKGTLYVILRGLKKNVLSKKIAKDYILELASSGFRLSPEVLGGVLREIEKIRD
ncbi:MAG: DUF3368 domain-containing protein [Methanosarcinales archaeon Met12]|nr:MAG: DUF3368 domain-containing protein [Methanosarcinales archaeon Met12]